ncbi:3-methyl-2-oxobutanoate hydroxymethyltransferase [Candidatus Marinamargulisbacteria bacterium SCGC AG-439-L15]|nr:3-methyl-2-oxobutanoate hydroxymethyltransferase [Candidatus Marinamargulisbacteria bacterium SCGC AG-439-L15]
MSKITPITLLKKKATAEKITMLTAYDYPTAQYIDQAGIDMILVGDSLGNVFSGHENTLPVTLEDIIYHTKAVKRGVQNSLIIADMPFMSYHISKEQAKENAGRLVKEGGCGAVKAEINVSQLSHIEAIIQTGIPVMAHIGFTPHAIHQIGGYKVQGKNEEDAQVLIEFAEALESIGVFAITLEMVPQTVAKEITEILKIPTIGIGAGPDCDGQVLVTNDLLGHQSNVSPKFVKPYANLGETIQTALETFKQEVSEGEFPDETHSY